jgi:hypothetical protein
VAHDVWAYEPVDALTARLRQSEAVLAELCRLNHIPPEQVEFVRRRYDPRRGLIRKWCAESAAPGCYDDEGAGI